MSLVARHLEEAGIPTVVVGSGRDIVEQCGIARFLFNDFPLGNPCGKPWDEPMQLSIVSMALDLLKSATLARTTVQTPFTWSQDQSWRDNFMYVDPDRGVELRAAGEQRRQTQTLKKS